MNVLGVITARGGSKGIPRKNLVEVAGKSLLAHTATCAMTSGLTRIVVSTDDQEIADHARELGLEVPFLRPPELALDSTPTIPVLQDVVRRLELEGCHYEAVFTLQPTNPLRLTSDIDGAIELLTITGADSVIGFSNVGERHPARMKLSNNLGQMIDPPFSEAFEGLRRQELPKFYLRDGSVYLTRRDVLMNQNSLKGDDCRGWLIPSCRSLNIDEPFDLELADFLLGREISRFLGQPISRT